MVNDALNSSLSSSLSSSLLENSLLFVGKSLFNTLAKSLCKSNKRNLILGTNCVTYANHEISLTFKISNYFPLISDDVRPKFMKVQWFVELINEKPQVVGMPYMQQASRYHHNRQLKRNAKNLYFKVVHTLFEAINQQFLDIIVSDGIIDLILEKQDQKILNNCSTEYCDRSRSSSVDFSSYIAQKDIEFNNEQMECAIPSANNNQASPKQDNNQLYRILRASKWLRNLNQKLIDKPTQPTKPSLEPTICKPNPKKPKRYTIKTSNQSNTLNPAQTPCVSSNSESTNKNSTFNLNKNNNKINKRYTIIKKSNSNKPPCCTDRDKSAELKKMNLSIPKKSMSEINKINMALRTLVSELNSNGTIHTKNLIENPPKCSAMGTNLDIIDDVTRRQHDLSAIRSGLNLNSFKSLRRQHNDLTVMSNRRFPKNISSNPSLQKIATTNDTSSSFRKPASRFSFHIANFHAASASINDITKAC